MTQNLAKLRVCRSNEDNGVTATKFKLECFKVMEEPTWQLVHPIFVTSSSTWKANARN